MMINKPIGVKALEIVQGVIMLSNLKGGHLYGHGSLGKIKIRNN
jgi:hypothetical protein